MTALYKIHIIVLLLVIPVWVNAQTLTFKQPELLATNMQFTEGPAWHPDGYLVFSDINGNTIYKWSESNGLQPFLTNAGFPNGIACSKRNDFVVCRQGNRDIVKMGTSGELTVLMADYKNKKLNSPNDVVFGYLGSIFFTDPDYGVSAENRELPWQGLFCIPYNNKTPVLLDSTLVKPNGLTFANDWRTLYVCESSSNTIYTYSLRDEYLIQDITKDKKVFVKVTGTGEIDGITADVFGNIYVAFGDGGMKVFDKTAKEIAQLSFPAGEKVRNLCFGGKYNNQLFVTAGKSLYKMEVRFFGDFIAPGILGVPTNKSVVFNAVADKSMETYIAYGASQASLDKQTSVQSFSAGNPIKITVDGLSANSRYYYQLMYKISGESAFKSSTSGSFTTQRSAGSTFSFAVEADPHLDEGSNYETFRNTLQNMLNLQADFLIDLGDNFLTEKFPIVDAYYIEQRNLLYRNFWDKTGHSIPLYIVQGNHDAELRWRSTNQADDMFNTATRIRKMYYPNPEPDGFYTGSEANELFVGKRENYYAWNWGDALFVVIDPYGYTAVKTDDPWSFTLGKTQYDWFRKTLEESHAKFKFVFAHQLVGGDYIGRGGMEKAGFFENGGLNSDGSYGFDDKRPGWGKPIHQLMVENGVQIYFHGHDHFYAEQEKDGVYYLEVPQPSFPGYTVANDAALYGYVSGTIIPNSGHVQVKITGDVAQIDYIGGYHIDNPKSNQINGQSRRTFYVNAKQVNTSVPQLGETQNFVSAYQSGNFIYVHSENIVKASIDLFSITGQMIGTLNNGNLSAGTSVYALPGEIAGGLYIVSIKSEKQSHNFKIYKQ